MAESNLVALRVLSHISFSYPRRYFLAFLGISVGESLE
jgi:hypothetical protein